jgi:hypothetical protein
MIEIAPEKYWKHLQFDEAKLYCFSLNINGKIGWRLPTHSEYMKFNSPWWRYACWHLSDPEVLHALDYITIPVRIIEPNLINRIRCIISSRYWND